MSQKHNKKKKISIITTAAVIIAAVVVAYFTGYSGLGNNPAKSDFDSTQDFIKVIDVGQAESILIYSNGYSALFDVGESDSAANVSSVLSQCNIEELDVIMVSHLHTDHIGGIKNIMEIFPVKNIIFPELSVNSEGMSLAQYAINKVTQDGGEVHTAKQGMNFTIGEFEITVLAAFEGMDDNNSSIIAVAEIDDRKFMFTGDAEAKVEKMLLNEGLNLKCDILSVGHHGSNTSSTQAFLKSVNPRYAVISAGKNNMYGHPHNEVLASLGSIDALIYRTDLQGDITFNFEAGKITAKTER